MLKGDIEKVDKDMKDRDGPIAPWAAWERIKRELQGSKKTPTNSPKAKICDYCQYFDIGDKILIGKKLYMKYCHQCGRKL